MNEPLPWKPPRPLPNRCLTPRTVLRFWELSDARSMFEALEVDRQSMLPWLPWVQHDNQSVEECIFHIERFKRAREEEDAGDFVIGIFDRETGEAIGGTGMHRVIHHAHQAEIGYWVRADRRGQGLCTEATAHLISWCFTPAEEGGWGFRRIEIQCAAGNTASRRVPEKLGLRKEVELKEARWVDGLGWHDTLAWGVLTYEWDRAAHRSRL
jgi:ribosomal-protein-serine acetyltransferase